MERALGVLKRFKLDVWTWACVAHRVHGTLPLQEEQHVFLRRKKKNVAKSDSFLVGDDVISAFACGQQRRRRQRVRRVVCSGSPAFADRERE